MKLNLDFSLYKGVTKLKQWYKEVKAHFTQVQEAHNALEDTVEVESGKLSTEITQRTNADIALGDRINAEENIRSSADTALGQRITTEENARTTADATLQQNINTEAANRQTADNAIDGRVKAVRKDIYGGYIVDGSFSDSDFQVQVDSSYSNATVTVTAGKSIKINGVQVSLPASFTISRISPADNVIQLYAEYDTTAKTIEWYCDSSSTHWPYYLNDNILQVYTCQIYFDLVYTDGVLVDVRPTVTSVGNIGLEITKNLSDLKTENKNSFLDAVNENTDKINSTALELQVHITQTPDTDGGVHGVRAADGKIEIFDGRNFVEMQKAYKTYGVSIDLTNSDPEAAVTYTDDAVGMVAGSSDWDNTNIFRDIRPCLFRNGMVVGYLDPDDFSKFADGTDADITSGDAGDVMIEIPKLGVKIATSDNILTVQVTDDPNAEGFQYLAHTREKSGDKDKLYIGAFLGYNLSSKLRSLCSKQPTANITIGQTRTLAQANGSGYDQIAFYQLTLLQCLFLIKYKNRDSQTALGRGYVTNNSRAIQTGGTVTKGMDFGETTGKQQMKFLGIEDFWGNLYYWIDGLVSSSNYHVLTATKNFNDDGTGYTDQGQIANDYVDGYMKTPQGTNELGFIVKTANGSQTTYFADYVYFDGGCVPYFGGGWDYDLSAGAFYLYVSVDASYSDDYRSGRLMYL